jgi:hypothetical protein
MNLPPPPVIIRLPATDITPPFKQILADSGLVKGNFNDLSTSISFCVGNNLPTTGSTVLKLSGC